MKSPITGKDMVAKVEPLVHEFRKEKFDILYHYYLCEDSGERFEDELFMQLNLNQVYNKYRNRHNLPFPDEIEALREQYGLSPGKMSEVLGFGVNVYRNYENGEIPNSSNARLIQLAKDPREFRKLTELASSLSDKEREKILKRTDELILEQESTEFNLTSYLMGNHLADEHTGYRTPNLAKFTEMVVFFTAECQPNLWKTKINKMLFYADFHHFRKEGHSISGCRYRAIDMGPVPNNYNSLFDHISNSGHIDILVTSFANGSIGDQFVPNKVRGFDDSILPPKEMDTLKEVAAKFKKTKTSEIIELSHKEEAWQKNFKEGKKLINYLDALGLVSI